MATQGSAVLSFQAVLLPKKTSHEASGSVREKWELVIELMPTAEAGKSSRDLPTVLLQACLSRDHCRLEQEIQEKGLGHFCRI